MNNLNLKSKILIIFLLLAFIFSVSVNRSNAQEIPPLPVDPEVNACGAPTNLEYYNNYTSVVGFDDNMPYIMMYNGGGGGEFSLEGISTVVPWFLPMSDQMMGYYNPVDYAVNFEIGKPFQTIRMLYPYGQGVMFEPNLDFIEPRDFRAPDEPWMDFIIQKFAYTDMNSDNILGRFGSFYKPLFVGCLQNLNETEGVKFPMYANSTEEHPVNQESASLHLSGVGAITDNIRIVPALDPENDTMFRFFKSTEREVAELPELFEPEKVNCFDCSSWAGDACEAPNFKVIWPQGDCEGGKCDDKGQAAQNLTLIDTPPDNIYVLFTYAHSRVPYTKYRAGTDGDFRFTRALSKVPGIQAIEDKFIPTDHVSKSAYALENTGGFTILNPVNFPNKVYHEYQSDASGWCVLQKSLSLRCDPAIPNFTGCWDYVGQENRFTNLPPAEIEYDGAPPGMIAKWCDVAWRGVPNVLPPGFN